jgi:hypothetical protein
MVFLESSLVRLSIFTGFGGTLYNIQVMEFIAEGLPKRLMMCGVLWDGISAMILLGPFPCVRCHWRGSLSLLSLRHLCFTTAVTLT